MPALYQTHLSPYPHFRKPLTFRKGLQKVKFCAGRGPVVDSVDWRTWRFSLAKGPKLAYSVSIGGFETFGELDDEGNPPRFSGDPRNEFDAQDVYGVFAHLVNEDDPDDEHWFWVYQMGDLEDWDEWYDYITDVAGDHGMALA